MEDALMLDKNVDRHDGLSVQPHEFILRFSPEEHDVEKNTHSSVWAFSLECGTKGIVLAKSEIDALMRIHDRYKDDARIKSFVRLDPQRNIFEIL